MAMPAELQAAFARKVEELIRQADSLTDEAIARAVRLLDETRAEVLHLLATTPPDRYTARYLRGLKGEIDRLIGDLDRTMDRGLSADLLRAEELGINTVEDPFRAIGVTTLPHPSLSRTLLEVAQDYSADLVKALGNEARQRINGYLNQTALGSIGSHDAITKIAGELPDRSVFSTLRGRAEAIHRTEVGRMYSVATEARTRQMAQRAPGLKKAWWSSNDSRTRSAHVTDPVVKVFADSGEPTIVAADAEFVVGGEFAKYPRDPSLSAGNSVNCRCNATPYVDTEVLQGLGLA